MVTTLTGARIRVTDAQVHLNLIGIDEAITAMDGIGIDRVVIDEWRGWDDRGERRPYYLTAAGIVKYEYPLAVESWVRHPDRFGYVAWLDRHDPDLDAELARIAANPHCVALRVVVRAEAGDDVALENGEYDAVISAAGGHGVPVMIALPRMRTHRRSQLLLGTVKRFDGVQFVIDHCGVLPLALDEEPAHRGPEALAASLAFAAVPNVVLKWAQVPVLSRQRFPFADITERLRIAIGEFGADRIMWGSDTTQTRAHHSWAEALNYIALTEQITDEDKRWVLGATAATVLSWPDAAS